MANRSVLGLYSQALSAADAVTSLRDAGFDERSFDVLTDTPYPPGAFGEGPARNRLWVFPLVGAACGFAVGLLLTVGTQIAYPMDTGGKPILAIPPMFIIIYEGTLLGAIIMTIVGFFFEARLPRSSIEPYDPRITEGYIGVLVSAPDADVNRAADLLRGAGAEEVIRPAAAEGT